MPDDICIADPIGDALGELLVPSPVTAEDMAFAVRAVVVHAGEDWPRGPIDGGDADAAPAS